MKPADRARWLIVVAALTMAPAAQLRADEASAPAAAAPAEEQPGESPAPSPAAAGEAPPAPPAEGSAEAPSSVPVGVETPPAAAETAAPSPPNPLDEAFSALRERGLPADPATLARPLIEAALRALDPGARLLEDAEAAPSEAPREPSASDPPPVESESLPRRLRIVRLRQLRDATADSAVREIDHAIRDDVAGLVLDLRRADGDSLAAAARVAARFAPPGADLFTVRDARGELVRVFAAPPAAPGERRRPPPPTIVLVGPETRGAAEALAAALDRQPGAMSAGRATAGEPLIRELVPLGGGLTARIATRRIEFADGAALDGSRRFSPRLALPTNAPPDPVERDPNGQLTDRRKTLPQEAEDRALRERVRGDGDLRAATDLLLGLIATSLQP